MPSLERKHRVSHAVTVDRGVSLRASIWSADEDKEAVAGVGIIEIEISNLRHYPLETSARVEAEGEDVRWEAEPATNRQMSVVLDAGETIRLSRPFEVDANLSHQHLIRVLGEVMAFHPPSNEIELSLSLLFNTTALSRLLFRTSRFEEICSTVAPDFEIANLELIQHVAKHPEHIHE